MLTMRMLTMIFGLFGTMAILGSVSVIADFFIERARRKFMAKLHGVHHPEKRTGTRRGTTCPAWEQTFEWAGQKTALGGAPLHLDVRNHHAAHLQLHGVHEPLGSAEVDLRALLERASAPALAPRVTVPSLHGPGWGVRRHAEAWTRLRRRASHPAQHAASLRHPALHDLLRPPPHPRRP